MRSLFIFLSIIPALVLGQDSLNVRQLGELSDSWDFGYDIVMQETLLYAATGQSGLRILNVADPSSPYEIGKLNKWFLCNEVAVYQNAVYLSTLENGEEVWSITVLDVSNPQLPTVVRNIEAPDRGYGLLVDDGFLYTATGDHISIYDLTDEFSPELISSIPSFYSCYNMTIRDSFLCVATFNGFRVIDISDPENCEVLSDLALGRHTHDVAVQNNYAFLPSNLGISVIDFSDPENPVEISFIERSGSQYVEIIDHSLIVGGGAVQIFDISDPENIWSAGLLSPGGGALTTSDGRLYISGMEPELIIFELADSNWVLRGEYDTRNYIYDFSLQGTTAFIAEVEGLRSADLSDPANPVTLDTVEIDDYARITPNGIAVNGNYAYVPLHSAAMRVYDISDPRDIEFVDSLEQFVNAHALTAYENYLWLRRTPYVYILDITNPVPTVLDSIIIDGFLTEIKPWGDYVYCQFEDTVCIIDASTPTNLEIASYYEWPEYTRAIDAYNGYLYAADVTGLRIFNLDNPESPIQVGWIELPDAVDVTVNGNYALVSAWTNGIFVVNVSNASAPEIVGSYNMPSWAVTGSLQHGLAYVSGFYQIGIYDISAALPVEAHHTELPTTFSLHPIYPNPFNNTANIAFDLPREVTGRLVVYDVLGRLTNTIYDGRLAAGSHNMQINGNNLSSGTYFIKLETPTFNATQKAVLLK